MRKRRVVRRALWDVEPRHVVVFVDRVEQAERAVRMRAEQPAWFGLELRLGFGFGLGIGLGLGLGLAGLVAYSEGTVECGCRGEVCLYERGASRAAGLAPRR